MLENVGSFIRLFNVSSDCLRCEFLAIFCYKFGLAPSPALMQDGPRIRNFGVSSYSMFLFMFAKTCVKSVNLGRRGKWRVSNGR